MTNTQCGDRELCLFLNVVKWRKILLREKDDDDRIIEKNKGYKAYSTVYHIIMLNDDQVDCVFSQDYFIDSLRVERREMTKKRVKVEKNWLENALRTMVDLWQI